MPRREPLTPRRRTGRAAPASVLAAFLLAACGGEDRGPLAVPPPTPDAAAAEACARLHDALPETVDEGERVETAPESDLTAAWLVRIDDDRSGHVVARCGVAAPQLAATTQLRNINDVDWFSPDAAVDAEHVYTTVGRVANLELTIPPGRAPAGALVDLADTVKATLPPQN